MPVPQISVIPANASLNDVINEFAKMQREFQYMTNAGIDTANMFEAGGWLVLPGRLMSEDGDVGMSTDDDGADPTRFWAGDSRDASPNFVVPRSGFITATGALIQSKQNGLYPRLELNGVNGLLAAYYTATNYLSINPDYFGSPNIVFDSGAITGSLGVAGDYFTLYCILGKMLIKSNNDIEITSGGKVNFDNWANVKNKATSRTLQQDLDDAKSTVGDGEYTAVTFTNGKVTGGRSLVVSDIPTLPQSKITNLTTDIASKASKTLTAWTALTLENSWVNLGGTYATAGYYKDDMSIVRLKGVLKSGTVADGTTIFTLPAGFRPSEDLMFSTISSSATAIQPTRVDIMIDGRVIIYNAANNYLTINNIQFRV